MIEIDIKEYVYLVWFEPDYASEHPESYPALQGIWGKYDDVPVLFKNEKEYDIVKERVQ